MSKTDPGLRQLALRVREEVYARFFPLQTTLFLCGARADQKDSVRRKIKIGLQKSRRFPKYDIFMPEDLFEESASGLHRQDLISLENSLADSVDAIVLILESMGSIAELGCFASYPRLRPKLVCLVDQKHKKGKSFIKDGPLRLLKKTKQGSVLYIDYADPSSAIGKVESAIRKAKNAGSKSRNVANVVQAHHFVLSCIYLLELMNQPVRQADLVELVRYASGVDEPRPRDLTASALAILRRSREVELMPDRGYRLSSEGLARFVALSDQAAKAKTAPSTEFDKLRVSILNWKYRAKRLVV